MWALLAGAGPAVAQQAGPPQKAPPAEDAIKIRVAPPWDACSALNEQIEVFRKEHPGVGFQRVRAKPDGAAQAEKLVRGELDVVLSVGPVFASAEVGGPRCDVLMEILQKGRCPHRVVAWEVLGVAVHPDNKLEEIDEEAVRKLLQRKVTSWSALGGPDKPVHVVWDQRVHYVAQQWAGTGLFRRGLWHFQISKGFGQLAADPLALGPFRVDERLTASGLKILPIRPAGSQKAVMPSPENVASGKYPFTSYLVVATRPGAPKTVEQFALQLDGAGLSRRLGTSNHWVYALEYTLPGQGRDDLWPRPRAGAKKPAAQGRLAILPREAATRWFLATAAYPPEIERAVVEGITADAGLEVADRAALGRALGEPLPTATGKPVVEADVLVYSYVGAEEGTPHLFVLAVHGTTACPLGWLKLSIDPARPGRFRNRVEKQVAAWWPGVLRNLAAVGDRATWAILTPPSGPAPSHASDRQRRQHERLVQTRAAIDKVLLADERVFFVRTELIPEAHRNVLVQLLGVHRPAAGLAMPAAHYLVDYRLDDEGRLHVRVLSGGDLKPRQETSLGADAAPETLGAWIAKQTTVLLRPAARPTQDGKPPRAVPAEQEAAAYAAAKAVCDRRDRTYAGILHKAETSRRYAEAFPGTPKARAMLCEAMSAYRSVATMFRPDPKLGMRSSTAVPPDVDPTAEAKRYLRLSMDCGNRFIASIHAPEGSKGIDRGWRGDNVCQVYGWNLPHFATLGPTDEEMEEVLAAYGRAHDAHPDKYKPSDLWRLWYRAHKKDRQGFAQLLEQMQRRWPDPKDAHWKLVKDEALELLCDLYETDPRATSFYWWLRAKRGPGNLPWEGYDPAGETGHARPPQQAHPRGSCRPTPSP